MQDTAPVAASTALAGAVANCTWLRLTDSESSVADGLSTNMRLRVTGPMHRLPPRSHASNESTCPTGTRADEGDCAMGVIVLDTKREALRTVPNAASSTGLDPRPHPTDLWAARGALLLVHAATFAGAQIMEAKVVAVRARRGWPYGVCDTNELRLRQLKPIERPAAVLPTERNALAHHRRRWADWLRSCHERVPRNPRCRSSGGCAG